MALTCSLGAKFHQVKVVLNMREQTTQADKLLSSVHNVRIQSDSMYQEINPFICRELLPLCDVILYINVGYLNGFQCLNLPSHLDVLTRNIAYSYNTPHAITAEQFGILLYILCTYGNVGDTQIGKAGMILVITFA